MVVRETHDQHEKRVRVWRHNGFLGQARRAELFFMAVSESDSTSDEAKKIAAKCLNEMFGLKAALKTRIDPQ